MKDSTLTCVYAVVPCNAPVVISVKGKVLYQNKNISTKAIKEIEPQKVQNYINKNGAYPPEIKIIQAQNYNYDINDQKLVWRTRNRV